MRTYKSSHVQSVVSHVATFTPIPKLFTQMSNVKGVKRPIVENAIR